MSGVAGGLRLFALRKGAMLVQKRPYIQSKPAQQNVGAMESVFALGVLTLAVLGPSGWILSQLDHYKARH